MDMFDLAGTLFGTRRDPVAQGSTLTATGSTASADGVAGIVIDADVTPAEGTGDEDVDQTVIDLPTSPDVAEGDEVIVTLVGDGPLKTPIVTANPGSGDRMAAAVQDAHDLAASVESIAQEAKEVAEATGQHFWPDTDGVHVTEVTQDEWNDSTSTSYHSGANVLLNALGQLFRDGLNNILAILSGTTPGVAIYDGQGNTADNILAEFTSDHVRVGGNVPTDGISSASVLFFDGDTDYGTSITATDNNSDSADYHSLLSDVRIATRTHDGGTQVPTGSAGESTLSLGQSIDYAEGDYYQTESTATLVATAAGGTDPTQSASASASLGVKAVTVDDSYERSYLTLNGTEVPMEQAINELAEGSGTLSYASGFKAYQDDSTRLPKWRRSGNVVSIRGAATPTSQIAANSATTIFTLPAAIRPSENIFGPRMQGSGMNSWYMAINANGTVQIERYGTTSNVAIPAGAWLPFFATYIID